MLSFEVYTDDFCNSISEFLKINVHLCTGMMNANEMG